MIFWHLHLGTFDNFQTIRWLQYRSVLDCQNRKMWCLICFGDWATDASKCPWGLLLPFSLLCPSALFFSLTSSCFLLPFYEVHELPSVLILCGVPFTCCWEILCSFGIRKKKMNSEADHMIDSSAVNDMSYVKHWKFIWCCLWEQNLKGNHYCEGQLINMDILLSCATKLPSLQGIC